VESGIQTAVSAPVLASHLWAHVARYHTKIELEPGHSVARTGG
jgi:hypothetical protein